MTSVASGGLAARSRLFGLTGLLLCGCPRLGYSQETPPTTVFSTTTTFDSSFSQGTSIAVGPAGNAYVLSLRFFPGISLQTTKYSQQGDKVLWTVNFPGIIFLNPNLLLFPAGIAVDGAGNAYVAMTDLNVSMGRVVKYGSDGTFIRLASAPFSGAPFFPSLTGIVFDPTTGHLYIAGTITNAGFVQNIFVAEYDAGLNQIGSPVIIDDGPSIADASGGISVDGAGNVYVGGTQFGQTLPAINSYLTAKYDPHLQTRVYKRSFLSDARFKFLRGVGSDPAGNVYVVGDEDTPDATSSQGAIVRLDQGGEAQPFASFQSTGSKSFDIFSSVKADAAGNGYVAAFSFSDNGAFTAIRTLKYSPAGSILWNVTHSPARFFNDFGVALDPQNNVYVTGGGKVEETVVIKYAQGGGTPRNIALLPASAVDGLVGEVGKALALPFAVAAKDDAGAAASGIGVEFSTTNAPVGATGQGVSPANVTTDPAGLASTILTLGNIPAEYQVTATCPTCRPEASRVTFNACGKLPNDDFEQFDPRWSTTTYDNTTETMEAEGCAVSSLAMLNNFYRNSVSTAIPQFDPGALNQSLRGLGALGYNPGGGVVWGGLHTLANNRIDFVERADIGSTRPIQDVINRADGDLAAGRPVIMRVKRRKSDGTFGRHFVLAVGRCRGEYIIADPGSATRARFDPNDANFQLTGIRRFAPAQ